MVFHEIEMGGGDFASIFSSVGEEKKEEEERKQTLLFLRLLDDIEERHTRTAPPRSEPRSESRSEPSFQKEYMRVSITDDDIAEKTRRNEREVKDRRDATVGKIHTIKDLPHDDFDFLMMSPLPELAMPEISVEAGRRLSDGKVTYHTNFTNVFGEWSENLFKFEITTLLALAIFFFGVYLGRRLSRLSNMMKPTQTIQQQPFYHPYQYQPYIVYANTSAIQPITQPNQQIIQK